MEKSQLVSDVGSMYQHTNHSEVRSKQRGIKNSEIVFVIQNSKPVYKQNICYYSLKNPIYYPEKLINDHIMNLVVITDNKTSTIITVYKSKSAWKKIKQKSKRLYKMN